MNAIAPIRVQRTGILHPNRLTPKDVARHAYSWNFEQLNEMVAILGGLQSAQRVQCTGEVTEVSESKRGRPGGSGYFEDKLIKGYGPYRYLRYWKNGHRRSVYVGKLTEETRNTTGARDV